MEHVTIDFKHGIQDLIPYTDFVLKIKSELEKSSLGEYLGDDMAIDGGDAEAIFSCASAKELFEFIKNDLASLPFMEGAEVTFTYGDLESNSPKEKFSI